MIKDKYTISKQDNIFLAKRKLVDNIYKSANLEGIAITLADTYSFMNNVNTDNISIPVEKIGKYFTKLIGYYETGDNLELKEWIYEHCIEGVEV